MSHTPGPWNIHPHYYPIDGEETVCADFRALTISIAKGEQLLGEASAFIPNEGHSTGYPRVNDYEEAKANARLMAAAPEMYEALDAILYELDNRYDGADDSRTQWMGEYVDKLFAVKLKAHNCASEYKCDVSRLEFDKAGIKAIESPQALQNFYLARAKKWGAANNPHAVSELGKAFDKRKAELEGQS